MSLEWNEQNIETLGVKYLQGVLGRLPKDASIAFGQTGMGVSPHYQVVLSNGEKKTYRGQNHEPYGETEVFDDRRLSKLFPQRLVLEVFCKIRDGKSTAAQFGL